jgi:hypothetical protein
MPSRPASAASPNMVEFYAVKAEKVVKNYRVHGQRQRREVSFVEVQSLVDEPELRRLIVNFGAKLSDRVRQKRKCNTSSFAVRQRLCWKAQRRLGRRGVDYRWTKAIASYQSCPKTHGRPRGYMLTLPEFTIDEWCA